MTTKQRILVAALLVTVPVDQLSKYWIDAHLACGERMAVIDGFFYLTHARNPGGAFGAFANADEGFRLLAFIVVSAIAVAVSTIFFRRLAPGDRVQALGLGLILGGAAGNFIDRILPTRGEVIDLLHFRLWGGYSWPDFNFADVFIVLGLAALMVDLLSKEGQSRV
jgi:signal peptidase II